MKVAVISPYCGETEDILRRCHESVRAQTHSCDHIFVSDGKPLIALDHWACEHIVLNGPHFDGGSVPRAIGSLQAAVQGYDAVAFLDADNWYHPEHIEQMIELHHETYQPIGVGSLDYHQLDGRFLGTPRDQGTSFADTNVYFVTREAFFTLPVWMHLPRERSRAPSTTKRPWTFGGLVCDRIFWQAISLAGVGMFRNSRSTVSVIARGSITYKNFGVSPPPGTNDLADVSEAMDWWNSLSQNERVGILIKGLPRAKRDEILDRKALAGDLGVLL